MGGPRGIVAGLIVVLILGAAAAYYFSAMPDSLASDYRDEAHPEHEKAEDALARVYRTFNAEVFGVRATVKEAKTPEQLVREMRRYVARERRHLTPVRDDIEDARKAMESLDEDALTDIPSLPALDGRGKLADAEDIAADEQQYLRSSERFLDDYEKLVKYHLAALSFEGRIGNTMGKGLARIPENPGSPEAFIRPAMRLSSQLESEVRRFKRNRAPADIRAEHNALVALMTHYADSFKGLADAVRNRDLAKINSFEREITRQEKRFERRTDDSVARLLRESSYAADIKRLRKLERELERAYDRLE